MLTKFISRVGTVGTRCAKRLAKSSLGSPNAQLSWKKSLDQFGNQKCSFSALPIQGSFSISPVTQQILSIADPLVAGRRMVQTKGDKELLDFLEDEISAEKKSHKPLPDLSPFKASFNDAEVVFTRKNGDETITVKFNVNGSVDADDSSDIDSKEAEQTPMVSRPNFTVEIEKGNKVLSFACSFAEEPYEEEQSQPQQDEEPYGDMFTVNEISVYEGDFCDTTYSTSGEILDGNLYDLLMNMLEDRGITNKFVEKLSDFSTAYEHQRYVGLLESLKKFFV